MTQSRSSSGSARRRLIPLGIVVAIAGIWLTWTLLDRASSGRTEPRPSESSAMDGMAGMDMGGTSSGGDGTVRLTAAQISTFGVTFGTVEMRTLSNEIRTVGIVKFDETRLAGVTLKIGGYIERLHVNATGQSVRRGQPLAELYAPELVSAQEELLLAARLETDVGRTGVPGVPAGASDLVAAARQRLRLWDISDEQIDRVLASGRAERTLTLYAPAGGIVVEKMVLPGMAVEAGETLYTIADLSRVWVEAELREPDANSIEEGSAVSIELTAFPGQQMTGRVEYVYPTLDNEARTLRARIAVANPGGRLKPGMYATVRLATPDARMLTVPASAVLNTGERSLVFVDMGQGRLMPHDVEIGRMSAGYAEVIAGLAPGLRVVTSAQYLLDSESNLAEVMKSMMGVTGTADMGSMDMSGMDKSGKER